jgi:hypothetical protein
MTNKLLANTIHQIACPVANLCNLLRRKVGVGSFWQLKALKENGVYRLGRNRQPYLSAVISSKKDKSPLLHENNVKSALACIGGWC